MRASEVMTRGVVVVDPGTPVQQAAALLTEHQITSLPVVDDGGRLVGIVSEVDLIRDRMPHDPRSHLGPVPRSGADPSPVVRQLMTPAVQCLPSSADTADLANLMVHHGIRAVPIVDSGKVVGIVSRRDLLRTLMRDDDVIRDDVTHRIAECVADPGRWRVLSTGGVVTLEGRFDSETQREVVTVLVRSVPGVLRVHTADRPG